MNVLRGRIVHSVVPEKIEVLNDHCIGYKEDLVSYNVVKHIHFQFGHLLDADSFH